MDVADLVAAIQADAVSIGECENRSPLEEDWTLATEFLPGRS